jgi:hypothetical protein
VEQILSVENRVYGADRRAGDDVKFHATEVKGMDDPSFVQSFGAAPGHHETPFDELLSAVGHFEPPIAQWWSIFQRISARLALVTGAIPGPGTKTVGTSNGGSGKS